MREKGSGKEEIIIIDTETYENTKVDDKNKMLNLSNVDKKL